MLIFPKLILTDFAVNGVVSWLRLIKMVFSSCLLPSRCLPSMAFIFSKYSFFPFLRDPKKYCKWFEREKKNSTRRVFASFVSSAFEECVISVKQSSNVPMNSSTEEKFSNVYTIVWIKFLSASVVIYDHYKRKKEKGRIINKKCFKKYIIGLKYTIIFMLGL